MKRVFFTSPFKRNIADDEVRRADEHLLQMGAGWVCTMPDGVPARTASGEYEARTEQEQLVRHLLQSHYGFTVTRTDDIS